MEKKEESFSAMRLRTGHGILVTDVQKGKGFECSQKVNEVLSQKKRGEDLDSEQKLNEQGLKNILLFAALSGQEPQEFEEDL